MIIFQVFGGKIPGISIEKDKETTKSLPITGSQNGKEIALTTTNLGNGLYEMNLNGKKEVTNDVKSWLDKNNIILDLNSKNLLDKWLSEQNKKSDNVDQGSAAAQASFTFNPNSTIKTNAEAKEVVEHMTRDRDDGFFKAV